MIDAAAIDAEAREMERAAVLAAIPPIAWSAAGITAVYALVQLWMRPSQVVAVWPLYLALCAIPLIFLALLHWGPLGTRREYSQRVFLASELLYTTALAAQLLGAETHPSGIAGFLAIKLLAVAAFVPWNPRYQWWSVGLTLLAYGLFLPYAPRLSLETHRLHLYAVPLIAGVCSLLAAHRLAGQRRELIEHAVARKLALSRLELLLEHMPAGCIVSDREFRYLYWNRAAQAIFGYALDEVRGKSSFSLITPEHLRALSRRGLELTARLGVVGPLRAENVTKDGRTIICEWSNVALRDPDGSLFGILSMCQDVTERYRDEEERRKALEKLRERDRLRSDFVATMAHELRNPLNSLLGYAELLREGGAGQLSAEQRVMIDRMSERARELIELVSSALDVSRLEVGQALVNLQLVQPGELLEEIRQEMADIQPQPGVQLVWELEAALPALYTDATKVKVIVKNLVSNALKYTSQGSVTVRARRHYPGLEISVADTGRGIPKEEVANIFRPFHQLRDGSNIEPPGAGLGLYIVQRFAELIGAEIHVESEVGRGSTFTVRLPAQPPGILLG
jgi:PAS domain S-box-containing protein